MRTAPASLVLITLCEIAGCSSADTPATTPAAKMSVEYIAHASFRLTGADGTTLLVDPFASRVWLGYDFPAAKLSADAVVITHPHYDHDYGEFIGNEVPWPGDGKEVFRAPADSKAFREFTLHGVEGRHAEPFGEEFGRLNTLWVVEHAGLRLVHWGDNEPLNPTVQAALGRVDVLLLPIDGQEHILGNDSVAAAISALAPRVIVPMHYRHPDLEASETSPEDLGPIDPWLEGRSDVTRLATSRMDFASDTLPETQSVFVFPHGEVP